MFVGMRFASHSSPRSRGRYRKLQDLLRGGDPCEFLSDYRLLHPRQSRPDACGAIFTEPRFRRADLKERDFVIGDRHFCRVEELALPTRAIQLSGEVLSTDEAASAELREAEAVHQTRSSCCLFKAAPTTPCICREQ